MTQMTTINRGRPAHRQRQFIAYVKDTVRTDGVAPSYDMICRELGISSRGEVRRLVCAAERAGQLRRVGKGRVRRIRLPEL